MQLPGQILQQFAMATVLATMSSDKDTMDTTQIPQTPTSGSSSSEGSDFVILSRPADNGAILGSPSDFTLQSNIGIPFASDGTSMVNPDQLFAAFNGLKQENIMMRGQLAEMNKAMQSRIGEIQTMREHQNNLNIDLKDKHQKAKHAVAHYQEQNRSLTERLKELIKKDNQNSAKVESMQTENFKLQSQLRGTEGAALPHHSTSTAAHTDTSSTPPSSLLIQMQEELKNAQDTRADIKKELGKMEEVGRQSEAALQKGTDTELKRLRQAVHCKDEEKQDLLKMNQDLQEKLQEMHKNRDEVVRESIETQSMPCFQSESFIEEEQGYSLMQDSQEFVAKPQIFENAMLQQIQNERDRSDKLSETLKQERTRIAELEKELKVTSQRLLERSCSYEEEVSEIQQRHNSEVESLEKKVDELTAAANEPRHNSGLELKQQVRSLVSEIQSMESDIKDRNQVIDNLNAEIAALRSKVTMYHDDMEKDREQSTQLIDSLRAELQRRERLGETHAMELQRKDTMCQAERQKALHQQLEHDRLNEASEKRQDEYDQLFTDYDNLTRNYEQLRVKHSQMQPMLMRQRKIEEQQDNLVARLYSAEEAIRAKEEENQKLKEDIHQMKTELETIPVLKAQAEVYKSDFDAERAAREKAHAEKEVLMNELETQRTECEHAQQEAANQTQTRVLEMQLRHGDTLGGAGQHGGQVGYGLQHPGCLDAWGVYGDGGALYGNTLYGADQAGAVIRENRTEHGQPQQQPGAIDRNVSCPKCMEQFPDLDTLQIHMLDCIQ